MLIFALLGAAVATEPSLELTPQVHVLPNGLTVLLEENRRTDSVALHLAYQVGSRDERPGELGCAHLFEHLMFEGSANVPTNAFDSWLTAAGGSNNAWTSADLTVYHMTFPSGALDLALFLESDRMGFLDAGIDDDNVANQRSVVLQERAEGYAQPGGRNWDALTRLTWPPGHPYHHPVIGTVEDVSGFQTDAVLDFWRRHYRPRNAVLALVGNFDPDEALERVQTWFADVPDRGATEPRAVAPVEPGERPFEDGMLEDDVEERTLYLVFPTVPLYHDDEPALDLLGRVLSGGRGTRLDDRLYYGSNLATSSAAFHFAEEIEGQMMVTASAPKTSLRRLDRVMSAEIARLVSQPPTEAELDRARRATRGWLLDRLEDNAERAEMMVDCWRAKGDGDCLADEWARYEAVTPDDLVRVARTYLTPERRLTLSVVPRGRGGALPGARTVELP